MFKYSSLVKSKNIRTKRDYEAPILLLVVTWPAAMFT